DFRFQGVPGNTNTYTLNITTFNHPDSGPGAALADTDVTAKDAVGKPIRADIRMDTNGATQGWYFDKVFDAGGNFRLDNPAVRTLSNPLSASRSGFNSPNDFYSTVLHEIGHAVGISSESGMRINNFLATDPSKPTRKFFNGPTTSATFTDDDAGLHL